MINALSPLLLALTLGGPAAAQESAYFTPFPESRLEDRKLKEFDEYELATSELLDGRPVKSLALEGRFIRLKYDNPRDRSTLEIMRSYDASLKKTGFAAIYACKGRECGTGCMTDKGLDWRCAGGEARYAAFKLNRAEGEVYLALFVTETETRVSILEKKGMEDRSAAASGASDSAPAPQAAAESAPAPAPSGPAAKQAADEVETGVIQGLTKYGFQAKAGSAEGAAADIIVEGKFATSPIDASGDKRWKWARSTLTLALKDGRSGKTFLRFDASDRQASADYKEAARRSRVELGKKASEQVQSAIADYFENQ